MNYQRVNRVKENTTGYSGVINRGYKVICVPKMPVDTNRRVLRATNKSTQYLIIVTTTGEVNDYRQHEDRSV